MRQDDKDIRAPKHVGPPCEVPGCKGRTRHSKPYCVDHIAMTSAHVAQLAKLAERSRDPIAYDVVCVICEGVFTSCSRAARYCTDVCRDLARERRSREAS